MSLLEIWNGPTSADLVFTLDKDGQLQGADGTAARPTYAFESLKTAGLYYIGSNNIAMSVNSTKLVDYSAGAVAVTGTITGSGILSIDDTTDTTSGTTGSIHTDGGLGVAKALWVGTTSRFVGVTTHGGNVVSDTNSTDDLGTTGVRWANLYVDDVTITTTATAGTSLVGGTMTMAGGSLTDSSGAISFGNENLSTTGTGASRLRICHARIIRGCWSTARSHRAVRQASRWDSTTAEL